MCFHHGKSMTRPQMRRYEGVDVTDMVVAFRNLYTVEEDQQTPAEKIGDMHRFAGSVLKKW